MYILISKCLNIVFCNLIIEACVDIFIYLGYIIKGRSNGYIGHSIEFRGYKCSARMSSKGTSYGT